MRRAIGRRRARSGARPRGSARRGRLLAQAFLGAPYVRDVLVAMGVLAETFETAITWERFPALPRAGDRAAR